MTWDETHGWIFSDEYHEWQDAHPRTPYRCGGEENVIDYGWSFGLCTIREDSDGMSLDGRKASSWPVPSPNHDLDKGMQ